MVQQKSSVWFSSWCVWYQLGSNQVMSPARSTICVSGSLSVSASRCLL